MPIRDISDLISDLSANKLSNLEELKLRELQSMIRQAQEGNLEFFKDYKKPDDAMKFYAGEGGQKKLEEFQSGDWGKRFTDEDKEEIYQSIMDQRSGGMLDKIAGGMNRGGMMNINRMTAPLGYKEAGEVVIRERIYNMLGPKDKISDEQLRLKGINPESVLPEERPVDPDQPEGVLQGLFGQLFGGRGAEGSELSPVEELKLLKLQLMLEKGMPGSTLMPSGDPDKIKRLENRIIELYTQLGE